MKRWGAALVVTLLACTAHTANEPLEVARTTGALSQGPWSVSASPLPPQLAGHTATLLAADTTRVVVVGGLNALDAPQDIAYVFTHNPAKHVFDVKPAGKLVEPRHSHTATLLATGKILIAGGEAVDARSTAELIDPAMLKASLTGAMRDRRTKHAAIRLSDGKVMVVGGKAAVLELSSAELYDPASGTWSDLPPMTNGRVYPTATELKDGKILVVGGTRKSADLFDPASKTWTRVGDLTENRIGHVAALLPSGKVLIAGGFTELAGPSSAAVTPSAEVYDPATKAFTKLPPMPTPRGNATATVFPNGTVLVAGGRVELTPLNYVDVYDEPTNAWRSATPMILPHALHTATLFPNNDMLVVGSAAAELFSQLAPATECSRGPDCASGFCVDGVCCNAACTGACERCDTSGARGTCTAVSGAFNHCAPGNTCIQNECVPSAGTTCSADRLSVVDKDGKASTCAPYSCDNSVGVCAKQCVSSVDCAPGFLCGNKQCVAAPTSEADSSGCTASPRAGQVGAGGLAFAALLAALGATARRRRR